MSMVSYDTITLLVLANDSLRENHSRDQAVTVTEASKLTQRISAVRKYIQ